MTPPMTDRPQLDDPGSSEEREEIDWRVAVAAAKTESRAARLQLNLVEARIHALRMELNPHFLFNTLNAVAGLVRKREHDAAIDMLARLGDLLRTTLDRDMPAEIPLS